jgi:hypothetical protein
VLSLPALTAELTLADALMFKHAVWNVLAVQEASLIHPVLHQTPQAAAAGCHSSAGQALTCTCHVRQQRVQGSLQAEMSTAAHISFSGLQVQPDERLSGGAPPQAPDQHL